MIKKSGTNQIFFAFFALLLISASSDTGDTTQSSDIPDDMSASVPEILEKPVQESHIQVEKLTRETAPPVQEYRTIEWFDLMPEDNLDALMNPPQYISEIQDGSLEDQISSQLQNAQAAANDDRYQQALVSTRVVGEMDGQAVRVAGFIVPLEYEDMEENIDLLGIGVEQTITEFFLVPYFGACIHVPPPPPNQIIHVTSEEGFKVSSIYAPYWISGVLKTSMTENDVAASAYSLEMQESEPYQF